jgi:phosphatidate cytidylyltransferase
MKQRLISSFIGLGVLFFVFALFDTIFFNIAVSIVTLMELSELLIATKFIKNSKLFLLGMGFSALIPFFDTKLIERFLPVICFVFTLMLLLIYLRDFPNLRVEHIGFVCTFLLLIAFSMTSLVYMRNMFGYSVGLYAVLVTLCAAWMSDTGAYFVGRAFGKHLLAPQISPKKTVEGLFGGIIIAMASQMLVGLLFMQYAAFIGRPIHINFWLLLIVSPILSLLSVVGDLSASAIKRQFGIKDFGKVMPGHGGALDRFDSVLLVAPFVFNLFLHIPITN